MFHVKHYSKEKLELLVGILQEVARDEKTWDEHRNAVAMFLAYITETARGVPGRKSSHKARWNAVQIGVLAMRWMVTSIWTRRYVSQLESPVLAMASIVDAVDRWHPSIRGATQDVRAVIRPIVRGMKGY